MTPEQIEKLRADFAAKSAELDRLIDDPKSTLAACNAADAEVGTLKKNLEEALAENARRDEIRGRAKAAAAYLNGASEKPPTSRDGAGKFGVKGFEDGGHSAFERDRDGRWSMIEESGPGAFGAKNWELFQGVEYRKDFAQYLRKGERFADMCTKTLMEGRDDQGGVFAPADVIMRVIGRSPAPTQLRGLVQTITTGKDAVEMPRKQYSADDRYTTAFRATWTGETPADPDATAINDSKVFGSISIPVHTAMLSAPMSKNLLEDASFAIQSWLEGELSQVIDLLYEEMIAVGDGNGKPEGILHGVSAANTTGTHVQFPKVVLSGSAAVTADFLDDIQCELPAQYENDNTRWVMNKRSTLKAIRKLKDTANRPLFTLGSQDYGIVGARGRILLGDPIAISDFMPDVGDGNAPIVYGDLRGYLLAQRVGFSIQVLNEVRAKRNQVELVGRVRFGGKVAEPFRLKIGMTAAA